MMNSFLEGFIKGAKETPLAYFAPLIAIWRLFSDTTDSLLHRPNSSTSKRQSVHQSD